jgi:hypothetical protein
MEVASCDGGVSQLPDRMREPFVACRCHVHVPDRIHGVLAGDHLRQCKPVRLELDLPLAILDLDEHRVCVLQRRLREGHDPLRLFGLVCWIVLLLGEAHRAHRHEPSLLDNRRERIPRWVKVTPLIFGQVPRQVDEER